METRRFGWVIDEKVEVVQVSIKKSNNTVSSNTTMDTDCKSKFNTSGEEKR